MRPVAPRAEAAGAVRTHRPAKDFDGECASQDSPHHEPPGVVEDDHGVGRRVDQVILVVGRPVQDPGRLVGQPDERLAVLGRPHDTKGVPLYQRQAGPGRQFTRQC